MGIKVPPLPPTPGDDCEYCWDPGETPAELFATFAGIATGEFWHPLLQPPPNGPFRLLQHPDYPCYYTYVGTHWSVFYDAAVRIPPLDRSSLKIWDEFMRSAFSCTRDGRCHVSFESNQIEWDLQWYYGGTGFIFHLL